MGTPFVSPCCNVSRGRTPLAPAELRVDTPYVTQCEWEVSIQVRKVSRSAAAACSGFAAHVCCMCGRARLPIDASSHQHAEQTAEAEVLVRSCCRPSFRLLSLPSVHRRLACRWATAPRCLSPVLRTPESTEDVWLGTALPHRASCAPAQRDNRALLKACMP